MRVIDIINTLDFIVEKAITVFIVLLALVISICYLPFYIVGKVIEKLSINEGDN